MSNIFIGEIMLLKLYKTSNANNVINKTLSDVEEIDILLKHDVDIVNPEIILIEIEGIDLKYFNYCELPELNRFYFIDSIEILNRVLCKLKCKCDLVETYRDDILNSNTLFKRKVVSGDYGKVDVELTGRENITNYMSDETLEVSERTILSVLGVK